MDGKSVGDYCGEWSVNGDYPYGRGVFVYPGGAIRIGYFQMSVPAPGSYIHMYKCPSGTCSHCYFDIGEIY